MTWSTLIAAFIAGALICGVSVSYCWRRELQRISKFLRQRDPRSKVRLNIELVGHVERELVESINHQLNLAQQERIAAARHAAIFQHELEALSHDIRTPLAGAKGYLQLAIDEDENEQKRHFLSSAHARLDDANKLVEALFAYSKSLDTTVVLEQKSVAVLPLLSRALVGHFPEFEARGWQPELTFEDEGCILIADEDALFRIFENLVSNALRHGSSAPHITQEGYGDGFRLVFENEINATESLELDRLFERFYQADRTRKTGNSGLGLATAYQLAQRMHLKLSAEQNSNSLCFVITKWPVVQNK